MKKIRFTIIALLCPVLLSGCMERDLEVRPSPGPDPDPAGVPVRLYTGILSRGLMDAFEGTSVGVVCGREPGVYTEVWEGVATGNEIVLAPERYYPADGSSLYVRGFHPLAPVQDGVLRYTLTGREDLMLSCEQSAALDTPFTSSADGLLVHRHLLVQLNFTLHLEGDAGSFRVRSMRLNGLSRDVTLSLSTGELIAGGNSTTVDVFTAPSGDRGLTAVDGSVELPGYVLVHPDAQLTLDLALSSDDDPSHDLVYHDLPVTFSEDGGTAGVAYSIGIKVNGLMEVTTMATTVPWESGDAGSGGIKGDDWTAN